MPSNSVNCTSSTVNTPVSVDVRSFESSIGPDPAPFGTTAVRLVGEMTWNVVVTPSNETFVTLSRFVPVKRTVAPGGAPSGARLCTDSGGVTTTNGSALVAEAVPLETTIDAVTAPLGTVVVICVSESIEPPAVKSPNLIGPTTLLNPTPVIVTVVPQSPLDGVKPVIERV